MATSMHSRHGGFALRQVSDEDVRRVDGVCQGGRRAVMVVAQFDGHFGRGLGEGEEEGVLECPVGARGLLLSLPLLEEGGE